MERFRKWLPFVLLCLLPAIPLWRALFLGEAIGPFDHIRQMAPWKGPLPATPWNVLAADGSLQFYGWRSMVLEAWGRGELPLWNPYELAGTPLLGNSQSAGFYPPLMLLGILHVPASFAVTLLAYLHLCLAGFGAARLARTVGANEISSWIAGALFASSPFMLSWIPLSSVIFTCAWIPWVLSYALELGESRDFKVVGRLGICVGMMLLAGHLQFAAFGIMALTLIAIWQAFSQAGINGARSALAVMLGLGLGVGFSAAQLLPVLHYSGFSHRKNVPTAEGYAAYSSSAIQAFELANLSGPTWLGDPNQVSSLPKPTVSTYWPALAKPGANLAESAITVGPLVLVLVALLNFRERKTWPIIGVSLLGLLIALGSPLDQLFYFAVPGWSGTGSPGRAEVLFVLGAIILASVSLSGERKPAPRVVLVACILTLLTAALAQLGKPPEGLEFMVAEAARGGLVDWAVAVAASLTILMLVRTQKLVALLAPLCIGSSMMFNAVPTGKPLEPVTGPENFKRIAVLNDDWSLFGVPHALLPPNTAGLNHIHELGGYDSLIHRDTVAMLRQVNGGKDPAPAANGNMMFIHNFVSFADLADAGVSEVWSLKTDRTDPELKRRTLDVAKVPVPGPGRVSIESGTAKIVEEGYDRIIVEADGSGRLVLKDRMMPGWEASIDGKPLQFSLPSASQPSGSTWREIDYPGGKHNVVFRYRPPGLGAGIVLSIFCIGLCIVFSIGNPVARKLNSGNPQPLIPEES